MRLISVIIIISILSFKVEGQRNYHVGKIYLTDGTVLEGYTEIPSRLFDNAINYKATNKSKQRSIFSSSIDSLEIETSMNTIKFLYANCDKYKIKSNTVKKRKRKRWLILNWETEHINVYCSADEYEFNDKGTVNVNGSNRIEFYFKKRGVSNCFLVYSYLGEFKSKKYFDSSLTYYCKDAPRLIKKIKNGDYTWERIYEVAETYNWCKSN